jgi:cobalamin-dependent methionine synthase I
VGLRGCPGRRKKDGTEVMPWMVDIMHEAVPGTGLSLDTTNAAVVEAGLKRCKELGIEAMINSASAAPERLETMMPLAAEYDCKIIALTMAANIPLTADGRVQIWRSLSPKRWNWASLWSISTLTRWS